MVVATFKCLFFVSSTSMAYVYKCLVLNVAFWVNLLKKILTLNILTWCIDVDLCIMCFFMATIVTSMRKNVNYCYAYSYG